MKKLPEVSCKYGAPMGRRSTNQDCVGKVSLQRIRLNGDYDSGGAYWGAGEPLYWATDESGALELFFRAKDRQAARQYVLEQWPQAKFYR